jgi:thiol-disulfide isomerase/thioredoxin
MHAQNNMCTIFGVAENRDGNVIAAYSQDDYITGTEIKLAEGIVGDSGKFSLTFELTQIERITIRSKKTHGVVFGEPGRKTEIIFSDRDPKAQVNPEVDYPVPLNVYVSDSTDMNFLADDYNTKFTEWWKENYMEFVTKDSTTAIDGFHDRMDQEYAWVKNPYFKPWMDYSLASMEDATFHAQVLTAKKYVVDKPIYYHNSSYMEFFNTFFQNYMYKWSIRKEGEGIPYAINNLVSYDSLMGTMKRLPWLANDTLRELVMLKGLYELYDNSVYNPKAILAIALQASTRSRIAEHRRIARNIIAIYTKMKVGTPAPLFLAMNRKHQEVSILDSLHGKYVYLFFFQTWNTHALDEMRYAADLQKKYGKKIIFVSVCIDDDTNAYNAFLKANPKYNWTILHYEGYQKTKEDYNLYVTPVGFLIDEDGKLFRSPADNPTGDLEYDLYRIQNPKAPPFVRIGDR